jgi:hypothetical protein
VTDVPVGKLRAAFRRFSSSNAARVLLAVAIVAACVALAHVFGVTLCPMKRLLGVPCPTCGTTRAFAELLRGDVFGAFARQPLVISCNLLGLPVLLVIRFVSDRRTMADLLAAVSRSVIVWCLVAAAVLANWIYVIRHGN